MRTAAIAGIATLALVLTACGGDEPASNTTTTPELLPPSGTSTTGTGTTGLTSTTRSRVRTIDDSGSGGGQDVATPAPEPAPEPEPEPEPEPPALPDNPKKDTPPPAGSSAERFEQFCAENPKQCGG